MAHKSLQRCLDACIACATQCQLLVKACVFEDDANQLANCVLTSRQCAAVCLATARLLSIGGNNATLLCAVCAELCWECASEYENYEAEDCQLCAEECYTCAEECRKMVEAFA